MPTLIAPCGSNCAECDAFKATKNNDDALRAKVAADWTVAHDFAFTPDMINCTGCMGDGVKVNFCSDMCEVRKCAVAKGAASCAACADYTTCDTIKGLLEYIKQAEAKHK